MQHCPDCGASVNVDSRVALPPDAVVLDIECCEKWLRSRGLVRSVYFGSEADLRSEFHTFEMLDRDGKPVVWTKDYHKDEGVK